LGPGCYRVSGDGRSGDGRSGVVAARGFDLQLEDILLIVVDSLKVVDRDSSRGCMRRGDLTLPRATMKKVRAHEWCKS
jgi:hypothetical protein